MRKRSEIVLKAFLATCPPEKQEALLRFLPEKEAHLLQKLPSVEQTIDPELFTTNSFLSKVHWSWFLPTLKAYPENEQKLFLAALPSTSTKSLAKTLEVLNREEEISIPAKHYLRQVLFDSLIDPHHPPLPVTYIPMTALTKLLTLSKKELVRLIDFLSMHDLAEELRQIVETKILKKIYSFLTEGEKKFLKTLAGHKDLVTVGRMGLDRWDGSEESFRTMLHRRGLVRFAAAISGQGTDFLWHICHQLDIGRGSALFKLCAKETSQPVREAMSKQVEELL